MKPATAFCSGVAAGLGPVNTCCGILFFWSSSKRGVQIWLEIYQNTPAQLLTACRDTNGFIAAGEQAIKALSSCNQFISSLANTSLANIAKT